LEFIALAKELFSFVLKRKVIETPGWRHLVWKYDSWDQSNSNRTSTVLVIRKCLGLTLECRQYKYLRLPKRLSPRLDNFPAGVNMRSQLDTSGYWFFINCCTKFGNLCSQIACLIVFIKFIWYAILW
jgi:hypothetical protein